MGVNPKSEIRNPQSYGFTLLEVMLAVAILALVIVSLLGLRNRSIQDVQRAERITTATLLARRMMTETLLVKLEQKETEGTFEEERYADYAWKRSVAPMQIASVLEVRVAVLWKDGDREETVELVGYE